MVALSDIGNRIASVWGRVPSVPDLPLPTPGDPDLVTVIGAVVLALGTMGLVTGWVDRRLAIVPLFSALAGAGLLVWVWNADRDGFGPMAVPVAFVEVVARLIR